MSKDRLHNGRVFLLLTIALCTQAMDNSIGNMGKQLGSLIHKDGQGGTNLQQTPTIDPANSFQQVGFLICSASVQAFGTWSASILFS